MTMRTLAAILLAAPFSTLAQGGTVYRCPGPPVLYTSEITDKEARERGCRTIENAPITIVAPPKPRPVSGGAAPAATRGEGSAGGRVSADEQRARDSDARKILESELKKEEEALAALQKEFNNGEPERQGGERNYQRYLDRVEGMREAIARKQADVAAIKREMAKLPTP
jgi:hypothetical protein